jgi:membrane protein implicated in regulation of membrane protease activity
MIQKKLKRNINKIVMVLTMFISIFLIAAISLAIFDNILYAFVLSTILVIIYYLLMKKIVSSINLKGRNKKIKESFKILKDKFSGENIVLELEIKDYGANLRIYVIDKIQKIVDDTINNVTNHLKEKGEINLYYTIQAIKVDDRNQIFKTRQMLRLNASERRRDILNK